MGKERYKARYGLMRQVEQKLKQLFKDSQGGILKEEGLKQVKLLESKKYKLLLDGEREWKIKS